LKWKVEEFLVHLEKYSNTFQEKYPTKVIKGPKVLLINFIYHFYMLYNN
jgi:hypothetical protein